MSKERERTGQTGRILINTTEYLMIDEVVDQSLGDIDQHDLIEPENCAH